MDKTPEDLGDSIAPPGTVWVCGACGKTSQDRFGEVGEHSPGWDASCMLNSILCMRDSLVFEGGRVVRADSSPDYYNEAQKSEPREEDE